MSDKIPDDVMAKAYEIVESLTEYQDGDEDAEIVARAIMAERESATKAERERCAGIADVRGRDCDGRYNESDDRYDMGGAASAEDIAAAIRREVR